jgi:serine/threonine-protein kinase
MGFKGDTVVSESRVQTQPAVFNPWSTCTSPEERRAHLHARLELLSKLMLASFAVLVAFLATLYGAYPALTPAANDIIFTGAVIGLVAVAAVWRGYLHGRAPSIEALYRVDLVYAVGSGAAFAASAYLARELQPAGYASLIYLVFTVFMRAIVVPSSARRTLVVSTLAFVPVLAAATGIAATTVLDLPGPAYVVGAVVLSAVAIALATVGSDSIYGLRRRIEPAMQLGQYTLEHKIGEGGMGVVYRARHAMLERPTALKVIKPDGVTHRMLERFEREVHYASRLVHPNTVTIYDYGRSLDGVLYYAMEHVDGIDLERLVRTRGPLSSRRVARILAQVAGALGEAHAAGMVHCDVKPANIILSQRGGADFAKVIDFGLVRATVDPELVSGFHGTPGYVSPEGVTAPATVGPPADLYALGAVGFFLLTGRPPFVGKTGQDIIVKQVTTAVPSPSSVTSRVVEPALEGIIMRCLAKAPADRYASAGAVAELLLECAEADEIYGDGEWQLVWQG